MRSLAVLFFILLFIGTATPGRAQSVTDEDCMRFHTGEFVDGTLSYVTISRDSMYQVETDTRTGKTSTFLITWVNACTYELKFVKSDDKKMRKSSKKIGVLTIEITYVDEEGYRYIATAPGLPVPVRGSVKVKK